MASLLHEIGSSRPDPSSHTIERAAPARVNLLGEHTDYTGGYVLPMAIPFYSLARIAPAEDNLYRFRSAILPGERSCAATDRTSRRGDWTDYPVGVLRQLQEQGLTPPPFHLDLGGNIPFGAGLSSSASVEVAACLAMLGLSGRSLPAAEVALLCQRAENDYVGSPCGIMDQFAITAAKAGHALLLNTRDLSFELIPMNTGDLRDTCIVVVNSEVKHSIADGAYGDRRKQAEAGQTVLRERFADVHDLGGATLDQLEQCADAMSSASYKRCRHIITENARVQQAKAAMLAGDPHRLGGLMLVAHASQRDDFECSCVEVDFLVDAAAQMPGCYGARLTGGGFGGCTVNLVRRDAAEAFTQALTAAYRKAFAIDCETYVCEAVDGAVARLESVAELGAGAR